MNAKAASASSIRRRLPLFLSPPLTVLMLVGVYVDYHSATLFIRAAYDQRLANVARALGTQLQQSGEVAHPGPTSLNGPVGVAFSITGSDGKLIAGEPRLPAAPSRTAPLSLLPARRRPPPHRR
jgi:hypothetical protein